MTRASGISVPLFSLVTRESWGIGELPDVAPFCRWAAGAGQSLVQILPVMELPEPETLAVLGADLVCAGSHLHRGAARAGLRGHRR